MSRLVAHHGPPSRRSYRWIEDETEALPGEVVERVDGARLDELLQMEAAYRDAQADQDR